VDARQRFLHPESLPLPRKLNPAISLRTERAILSAMELHPDDRPGSAEEISSALARNARIACPAAGTNSPQGLITDVTRGKPEQVLFGHRLGLLLISLVASLIP